VRAGRLVAEAKLNLLLHAHAREAGGYHAVETLFQRIALGDDVRVAVGGAGRSLDCRGADVGPVERNLAWRAALAYADAAGWPTGFAIELDKRVPTGAGLGGGSADAGAVLRILNALAPSPLPAAALLALAAPLGSDVPFLTAERPTALAWGRGERMLALAPLPARDVRLLLPDAAVATADAYAWLAADRGAFRPAARLLDAAALATWAGVAALAANDFEGPVAARVPAVAALRAWRDAAAGVAADAAGDAIVRMSGSGAAWFAIGAADAAPPPGVRVVRTATVDRVAPVRLEE
jgi:4-diphosphocytidyl-2-C-methyl-D-erythritol kinase